MHSPIVSIKWLSAHFDDENLIILDASMINVVGRTPSKYDIPIYIPNSQKFDLESVFLDTTSSVPNAFPTEDHYTSSIHKLGINDESIVVIYDNQGIYSSPRAWMIFKIMGFENVYILNGGLPQWLSESKPYEAEYKINTKIGTANSSMNPNKICDSTFIASNIKGKKIPVLDARSEERFLGLSPEPRQGMRSGHIPTARNLPFQEVLNGNSYRTKDELIDIFSNLPINKNEPIIFSCGSGITACIILVGAVIAGYTNTILYDGSWADWGSDLQLPVE